MSVDKFVKRQQSKTDWHRAAGSSDTDYADHAAQIRHRVPNNVVSFPKPLSRSPNRYLSFPSSGLGTSLLEALLPVKRSRASRKLVPKPELGNQA